MSLDSRPAVSYGSEARIFVAPRLTCRTHRRNTAGMHSRRFQLFLLAAIVFAGGSTTAGSSAGAREASHAARLRGSILFSSNHGIYRRYPGGALKQLTTNANDAFPVWSRDGTQVAFEQIAPPSLSCPLMVMNSDGSGVHQVGQVNTDCSGAGWGPHDRQLVFGTGPQKASLWIVNADGSGLRRILQGSGGNPEGTHPAWSPDGRTIVTGWTAGPLSGLLALRPDGSHLHVLIKSPHGKAEAFAQPTWSRDGKRLAFVRALLTNNTKTLLVASSSGRNRRALAGLPLDSLMSTPSWSPKGSLIAFTGRCGQRACLWTIPSVGGKRRVLMRGQFQQANWGPART